MGSKTDFITAMMGAMANCTLYSDQHQIVRDLNEKAFSSIEGLFIDGTLSITLLGDSLIMNDEQMAEKGYHIDNFIVRLRRKGLDKVIFGRGVTQEELLRFITGIASKDEIQSSAHIALGIVEVSKSTDGVSAKALAEENLAKLRRLFEGARGMEPLDMATLDSIVAGMLSSLRGEPNVLKVVSTVRAYDEYTYVHATNVSLLTIFHAETMGISGELLYDIGLAALLHDIGKMFIPVELLEKRTGLTSDDWDSMKMHPVYGARYLSGLPDMPKLAMITAYEHHMRYDAAGYPLSTRQGKMQHLVSQMVAIADAFDAMRSETPYRRAVDINEIRAMMTHGAGVVFNPEMVAGFWKALGTCAPGMQGLT
ncbi:MAG: HD domain-containing phosphohydrolase [Thermodesulfovibrionales bacterium]